jgi:hypothetical protein
VKDYLQLKWLQSTITLILLSILAGCNLPAMTESEAQSQVKVPEQLETIAYIYAEMTADANLAGEVIQDTSTSVPKSIPTESEPTEEPPKPTETSTDTPAPSATSTDIPASVPMLPASTNTPMASPTEMPEQATSTPTLTLTATNVPSATYAGDSHKLCEYGAGAIYAAQFLTPVNVDGDTHFWNLAVYDVPFVVYGADRHSGDWDLDPTYQVGWSNDYLYLAVRVQDDRYRQFSDGAAQIYQGDSVEIFFDADLCGDFGNNSMSSDDFQIGISPGYVDISGPKYAYQWYPSSQRLFNVLVGSNRTPEGQTYYEIGIPWTVLGISNPHPGSAFGFALSVSDNDDPNANKQETMLSSVHRAFKPEVWSTLILQ